MLQKSENKSVPMFAYFSSNEPVTAVTFLQGKIAYKLPTQMPSKLYSLFQIIRKI